MDGEGYESARDHFIADYVWENFVIPEVQRRVQSGEIQAPSEVNKAQVLFFSDGRVAPVRINDEVKARLSEVKLVEGIKEQPQEPVWPHEMISCRLERLEDDSPEAGHATYVNLGHTGVVAVDIRFNLVFSGMYLKAAEEFFAAAEFMFDQHYWSAFIDNLFSAMELGVISGLALLPRTKVGGRGSHKLVHHEFNKLYRDYPDLEEKYRRAYNKLSNIRGAARYLDKGQFVFEASEASQLLETVREMLHRARVDLSIEK